MIKVSDECIAFLVNDSMEQLGIAVNDEGLVVNLLVFTHIHKPMAIVITVEPVWQARVTEVLPECIVPGVAYLYLQSVIVLPLRKFRQGSMVQHHREMLVRIEEEVYFTVSVVVHPK